MSVCHVIISNHGSIDAPLFKYMSEEFKKYIAINTGNLLINEYGKKQLDYEFLSDPVFNPSKEFDEVLILSANDLRPNTLSDESFNIWSEWLEKQNKPVHMMGLGASATLENMKPKEYVKTLTKGIVRWVSTVADKCESIGVRGEFTADVLKELGITNVDVIGCPTWFVNGYHQPLIEKKEWSNDFKPAFHTAWDPYTDWHAAWHNAILRQMLTLQDPKFIMQSEFNFLPYMIANKDMAQFVAAGLGAEDLRKSAESVMKHFAISEFDVWQNPKIKNMFEMFGNIGDWAKLIKTRDFSFGFRIHGSVIAIKNGVPAICLCSDSRTYELCKLFHIPFLKVNEIASDDLNIREIYENSDFTNLNKAYPKLLQNYIRFLDKNNIKHKFTIE